MTTMTIHADDELGADLATRDAHFNQVPMLSVILV